jgi:hypothetical protein
MSKVIKESIPGMPVEYYSHTDSAPRFEERINKAAHMDEFTASLVLKQLHGLNHTNCVIIDHDMSK